MTAMELLADDWQEFEDLQSYLNKTGAWDISPGSGLVHLEEVHLMSNVIVAQSAETGHVARSGALTVQDKVTVIPVVMQGNRCIVSCHEPGTENKLIELYTYIWHLPTAYKWDITSLAIALLKQVHEVMQRSQVYLCEVGGVDVEKHGRLVFVLDSFISAGARITWQMVDENIHYYLGVFDE